MMRLLHPCPGAVVTLPFGAQLSADPGYYLWLGYAGHEGVDFRAAIGTPVRAAHAGVARRHWSSGYGLYVAIESASARTVYAHLSEAQIVDRQQVVAGQIIGLSGDSGTAYGAHLHFGYCPLPRRWDNGYKGYVDPLPYLSDSVNGENDMAARRGVLIPYYQLPPESGPSVDVVQSSACPMALCMHVDEVATRLLPGKRIFARLWLELDKERRGDPFEHSLMARGTAGAHDYAALLTHRYQHLKDMGILDVLGPNEPHPRSDSEWASYVAFTETWIGLMAQLGMRPWIWNWSNGTPEIETVPRWVNSVIMARQAGGGLSMHCYNAPHLLNDPHGEWPQYSDLWLSRRYELVIDALYRAGMSPSSNWLLIGECGIDGLTIHWNGDPAFRDKRRRLGWRDWADWGITWEVYRSELQAWSERIAERFPEVIAAAVFESHPRAAWATYNLDAPQLEWIVSTWSGSGQPPEPPPPADDLSAVLDSIVAEGQRIVVPYNPATAFARAARVRGYVPASDEFRTVRDGVTYVAQGWRDPKEAGLTPAFPRQYWTVCRDGDWGNVMWWERMN